MAYQRNEYSNTFFAVVEGSVEAVGPASDIERDSDRSTRVAPRERSGVHSAGEFFGAGSLLSSPTACT